MVVNSRQEPFWKGGDWVAIEMFHHAFLASYALYGDLHNPMRFVYIEHGKAVA